VPRCGAEGLPAQVVFRLGILDLVEEQVGYPVLVRPSYVLSGAAMRVVNDREHLQRFLERAALVSPDYPVVISHYETGAKEIEIEEVEHRSPVEILDELDALEVGIQDGLKRLREMLA